MADVTTALSEAQQRLVAMLEPIPEGTTFVDDKETFLCSIAISQKRIADALWGTNDTAGLLWLFGEYTNRPR